MDEKLQIQLGENKNINSINVDNYSKILLKNKISDITEYDIRNILNVTEIFNKERQASETYRIYGSFEYMSILNNMISDYKYIGDFFNNPIPYTSTENRKDINGFDFYLVKPTTGYTQISGHPTNYIRKFEVIATPNDFELIEAWGMLDGSKWKVDGSNTTNINNFIRKPEIYKGNPELQGSFGETPEKSEWIKRDMKYWRSQNAKGAFVRLNIALDIGQHYFIEPTFYKSTVASLIYKLSDGYSHDELIRGVISGTTASEFLQSIIKDDPDQTLKVVAESDGSELGSDVALNMNDTLIVLSADSTNTTKYVLEVTESGLRSDAVLTSDVYEISIDAQPKSTGDESTAGQGTITG